MMNRWVFDRQYYNFSLVHVYRIRMQIKFKCIFAFFLIADKYNFGRPSEHWICKMRLSLSIYETENWMLQPLYDIFNQHTNNCIG